MKAREEPKSPTGSPTLVPPTGLATAKLRFYASLMFAEQPRPLERVFNGMGITSFSKGSEECRCEKREVTGELRGGSAAAGEWGPLTAEDAAARGKAWATCGR